MGLWKICLVNHPDFLKELLIERQRDLAKIGTEVGPVKAILGRGLLTNNGDEHLRHRRLLQPAFHRGKINGYARVMSELAQRFSDRCQVGVSVDVYNEMSVLTLAVMASALFGADVEGISTHVRTALMDVFRSWNFSRLALPNWASSLFRGRRVRQALRSLDDIIYRIINERRASPDGRQDLLSLILNAREGGESFSDQQVRDQVMTFFLAGHETIATTLAWTWHTLAEHPEVEARLHAEVDSALAGRVPQFEDLPRLPYVSMVLREVLRQYPPIWVLWRKALRDIPVGPYVIPRNTILLLSPYVTQHDARWYPEPDRFDPERWRDEKEADRRPFAYFPFGAGSRLCIGEQFGFTEGVLVIATLARQWKLRLVPGQKIVPFPGPVLRPRDGIHVTFEARVPQRS
jgi:cytochrome P450